MTPVRPIRNDDDHRAALAEIDRLFGAASGSADADRLEVLCVLAADYERRQDQLGAPDPVDYLSLAMTAQGRSQSDLAARFGSRSRAAEVLNRRRHLSAEMIGRLVRDWSLAAGPLSVPYEIAGGLKRGLARGLAAVGIVAMLATGAVAATFWAYGRGLAGEAEIAALASDVAVPLADIPPHVVKAFLAAEDADYYGHGGYSLPAILRAGIDNVAKLGSGAKPAGAATITQQLAKNLLLAGQPPSLERKLREIVLARRLEAVLSKDRILELYLNRIYFGGPAWGIAQASRQYFGKAPAELDLAEGAYLAALPKAPNDYRLGGDLAPDGLREARARDRRDWVLGRMAADGMITASAARMAQNEALSVIR